MVIGRGSRFWCILVVYFLVVFFELVFRVSIGLEKEIVDAVVREI